jgi:hypothetical protein
MRQRLWFRLEHVLPLAEHAVACLEHRITPVQVLSGAENGPALLWTGTASADLLTSNGVPTWHDQGGSIHAAAAFTWRDTAGRRGGARLGAYTTAYLPLTDNPVADMLRSARITADHWVTVDIDQAGEHLIAAHQVHTVTCRHDLVPDGTRWIPAAVTCRDVDDQPYPALIAHSCVSAGGALLARFDRKTIQQMIDDLTVVHANPDRDSDAMPGEYPTLELRGSELVVLDDTDSGAEVTRRVSDRITADADGRYPLGAYLWDWRLVP